MARKTIAEFDGSRGGVETIDRVVEEYTKEGLFAVIGWLGRHLLPVARTFQKRTHQYCGMVSRCGEGAGGFNRSEPALERGSFLIASEHWFHVRLLVLMGLPR